MSGKLQGANHRKEEGIHGNYAVDLHRYEVPMNETLCQFCCTWDREYDHEFTAYVPYQFQNKAPRPETPLRF